MIKMDYDLLERGGMDEDLILYLCDKDVLSHHIVSDLLMVMTGKIFHSGENDE